MDSKDFFSYGVYSWILIFITKSSLVYNQLSMGIIMFLLPFTVAQQTIYWSFLLMLMEQEGK